MLSGVQDACAIAVSHGPRRSAWVLDDLHRWGGPPPGANAGRGVLEVGFKARREHARTRLWPPPLPDARHPERSVPSLRCGESAPQHRLRPGAPSSSGWRERLENGGNALRLDVCSPDTVDAGTAPRRADFPPGPPQESRPEEAVVERREAALPAPLGRLVELALAWS